MKKFLFILLTLPILGSCCSNDTLNIYIENGSSSQGMLVYLDDKLVKEVNIPKGENVIVNKHVSLLLPAKETVKIRFEIANTDRITECVINKKELSKGTWLHVARGERVFKKGWSYFGRILEKDTVMESNFYCELVDQPICGSIEE